MTAVKTIENRWDILYRDYPEVYDEFARTQNRVPLVRLINRIVGLRGKTILDVGSGTGLSALDLARYAGLVIGLEPEVAMRKVALRNAKKRRISNVKFIRGKAEKIPIEDNSIDVVTCFTGLPYPRKKIPKFVSEATRVVRDGGSIAIVEIPPRWYGGELASIIEDKAEDLVQVDRILSDHGFGHKDTFTIQKFRSVKKAVDTFGFIFGRKAIDYLLAHNKRSIRYKFRTYYKKVAKY